MAECTVWFAGIILQNIRKVSNQKSKSFSKLLHARSCEGSEAPMLLLLKLQGSSQWLQWVQGTTLLLWKRLTRRRTVYFQEHGVSVHCSNYFSVSWVRVQGVSCHGVWRFLSFAKHVIFGNLLGSGHGTISNGTTLPIKTSLQIISGWQPRK